MSARLKPLPETMEKISKPSPLPSPIRWERENLLQRWKKTLPPERSTESGNFQPVC